MNFHGQTWQEKNDVIYHLCFCEISYDVHSEIPVEIDVIASGPDILLEAV